MNNKEVVSALAINCEGVLPDKNEPTPLVDKPAQITVSVYSDGARDVGCPYLIKPIGTCRAPQLDESWHPNFEKTKCIHLFPVDSTKTEIPRPRVWM